MSATHPQIALPQPSSRLSRLVDWLRSLAEFREAPEVPFDHAVAALLVHAASLHGPATSVRCARIAALLRSYLGRDEAAARSLMLQARGEDDRAVDLHHFARVVNRTLPQEGRIAILDMAAQVAFADAAGAEEEGYLRLLGGLLGISDHDRGIVQHRARTTRQTLSTSNPEPETKESRHA
ncbi:MAG: TerB family tellurite resistance protein [Alphaproteobacteria bacterium]|nr:TerB family tellurite resistance protein [Alphaproteobacteria bacterium]